ncbi:MAG: D-2-hydroxyacid dehydrogenase [Chloroflexota bacterium]|nr:D-2-hydroxyacid dehydrogenase [Chloroflexota bacterium]
MPEVEYVLATVSYQGEHLEKLRGACAPADVVVLRRDDAGGIATALERADVAVLAGDLDERHLRAPRLKWVHCDHAGLNKSARPEVFERGLLVTSSAGRSAPALAEHALFFMLALAYNFTAFLEAQRGHRWGIVGQDSLHGLYGRTVGIVGLGNTGSELAVRAQACGMRVLGYRRSVGAAPAGVDRLYSAARGETLESLLRESDFVVLAVPLSDATHHLIGERELGQMKPGAFLVNMARGAVVDEVALLAALRDGRLAGAGLDTFSQEPLPAESPLWDAPNVLITPHVTPQVPDRTGRSLDIIVENVRRYRAGDPLLNQLRPEDVYTKG